MRSYRSEKGLYYHNYVIKATFMIMRDLIIRVN